MLFCCKIRFVVNCVHFGWLNLSKKFSYPSLVLFWAGFSDFHTLVWFCWELDFSIFHTLVWCDLGQTHSLLLSFSSQLLFDFPLFSSNGKTFFSTFHIFGGNQLDDEYYYGWIILKPFSFVWSMWGWRAIRKSVSRNLSKVEIAPTQLCQRFPIARIPFSFLHKRVKVKQMNNMVGTTFVPYVTILNCSLKHNFHMWNVKN